MVSRSTARKPHTLKTGDEEIPIAVARADRKPRRTTTKKTSRSFGLLEAAILTAVLVMIVVMAAVPLNNYFSQRAEIAALHADIAAKEQTLAQLTKETQKYQDPAYLQEQARIRLGAALPGERIYRIQDPAISAATSDTTPQIATETKQQPWYEALWDQLGEVPNYPATAEAEAQTN